jgi:hypothetical protein
MVSPTRRLARRLGGGLLVGRWARSSGRPAEGRRHPPHNQHQPLHHPPQWSRKAVSSLQNPRWHSAEPDLTFRGSLAWRSASALLEVAQGSGQSQTGQAGPDDGDPVVVHPTVLHPGWPTPSGARAADGHACGGVEHRCAASPQAAEHDASRRAGQGRRHGVTTWRRMPVRGRPGGPRGSGCCQPPGRGIRPRAHPEGIGRGTALSAVGPGRPGVGPALARIAWTMCLASLSMPGRNPDDMA